MCNLIFKQSVTDCNQPVTNCHGLNAAAMRDAANSELLNSIKSYQINSSKARKALEEIMAYVADMVCRSEKNESLRKAIYNSARYALSAPARNCDVFEGHTVEDEFEKAMRFPPSQTADERDELMRENWFLFKLWLFAEAKGENK